MRFQEIIFQTDAENFSFLSCKTKKFYSQKSRSLLTGRESSNKWRLLSQFSVKVLNTGFNTSSMLVINHLVQKTVKTVKEEPKYTTITFISDVGGILGIFLGFSLWSIHSAIIAPFVKKLESKISDHMMQNDSSETIVGY